MLTDIVNNIIEDLVYPKKLDMPLPCVNYSFKIDKEELLLKKFLSKNFI